MTVINELDSTCRISDEELTRRFKESIRIDNEIRKERIYTIISSIFPL